MTKEVQDVLLLLIDSPIDSWVMDSRASFHTITHREIMENYFFGIMERYILLMENI